MVKRKSKRSRPVRPLPVPRRVQRAKPRSHGRMVNLDPFVHCVLGAIDMPGSSIGVPDGSNEPSVVIEHRQTVVLTPVGGIISFALVSSPVGAVGLGTANTSVTAQTARTAYNTQYDGNASLEYIESSAEVPMYVTADSGVLEGQFISYYPIVPFSEHIKEGVGDWSSWAGGTGMQPTRYRVVTTQATVSYTGSSMMNNGVATTARMSHHLFDNIGLPIEAQTDSDFVHGVLNRGTRVIQRPPTQFSQVASMPGSRVFPVKEGCMLINTPNNFDYQDIKESWVPFWQDSSGSEVDFVFPTLAQSKYRPTATDQLAPQPGPSIGMGYAPVTYYHARGMDASASLTVCVRTCVEYTLSFNAPSARFAKVPPPERPLAIKQVRDVGRTLPSSAPTNAQTAQHGWLYNAGAWYGNTMKNIIGTSWKVGGQLISAIGGGGAGSSIGALTQRTGQLMIGN